MTLQELSGKQIAVLGSGENHKHLVSYLRSHGIKFELFDKWKSDLDLNVLGFDLVFRTPGLRLESKSIQDAKAGGAAIYSQTKLFFDLCPARIIGVTGTKGKGTTASLIAQILEAGGQKTYLAGNIGRDPFEFLDELSPKDMIVLELSSFQLEDLHKSPAIAVVLKITPEHLDHHETFQKYWNAKTPIVRFQSAEDMAVLNYDSEITRGFAKLSAGQIVWNSITQKVDPGCFVQDDKIFLGGQPVMDVSEVQLLGRFNLENVTAAIAASFAAGVNDLKTISKTVAEFKGLEHRLEYTGEWRGARYYDDSFSTTPETAIAALGVFKEPIILIAGGSEKNADYAELGKTIAEKKVKALLAIGSTGPKIAAAARAAGYFGKVYDVNLDSMERIVAKAGEISDPGDVVLLSPGSASFDMFANYKQRGELFKQNVQKSSGKVLETA